MKWNTLLSATTHIANQSMGGYSEARFPLEVVEIVTTQAAGNGFAARYPYNVIGAFGQGWDDVQTMNQVIVDAAKAKTNASRQVIVSNEEDFFADFEATYPLASLPVKSVSYGNEWELYCASLAETSARVKRATEKLRPAEALAAIESQLDPTFMNGREADRDLAFMDLGLYLEHDFGMAGAPGGQPTINARVQWQKRLAGEIDAYVDDLHADGVTALGRRIPGAGGATRFFAFNPLGWQRSAPADFAYAGPTPFHVVDVATQTEVRSQLVTAGGPARIRILAENVPSLGYRVYEVRQGAGTSFPPAASVNGGQMLSARYSLTVAGDGAITSLVDRAQNGRQFAEQIGGLWLNDPGTGGGTLTVEDAGPVSVTLRADSSQPLQHSTRVTLYTGVQRVDIENRITQNFSSDQTWSFGFKLTSPRVRHEEVGAILEARLDSQGGHYSSRNARYDWLTLNHFADISGNDGAGVTLSNADCYFFKLGNSTVGTLDSSTPRLTVLAGGRPNFGNGLPNQGGDTLFVQRFALQTHVGYDATQAMRMALEHQNPLVCGAVTSSASALPADVFSALSISDPDVLLWAFKPAEEGVQAGLIARVWNVSNQPQAADLQLAPTAIASARGTTHIETDETFEPVGSAGLGVVLGPQQMRTYRLLRDSSTTTYCTAKTNSNGCSPSIAFAGTPSASAGSGFVLSAGNVLSNVPGVFFYGKTGPQAAPFQGGWLCAKPPVRRSNSMGSGGAGPCGGLLSFDFNAFAAGGGDPQLAPGVQVNGQFWSRDPGNAFGSNLSNAVQFTLGP